MELIPAWFEEGDEKNSRFRMHFDDGILSFTDRLTGEIHELSVELSQAQAENIAQRVFILIETYFGLPDITES